ncbi:MAG: type II methionyl aminopeptidase [Thermoplasmata archaeon]|nr:type II methionyl aminopeptidase [Thermoplasmata archaeon]
MDEKAEEKYLKAGKIASIARELGRELVVEGASYREVADSIEFKIEQQGGKVAFPVNIAVDIVAAHFTPSSSDSLVFKKGMLAKIDVGAHVDGYIADTTFTKEIGTKRWAELIKAAEEALEAAIDVTKPGVRAKMIGGAVERTIESYGYTPITNLTGHSLKRYNLHAGLSIPNIMDDNNDIIKEGDVIAIEPFATNGAGRVAGRKSGNIFRMMRKREVDDPKLNELIEKIYEEFRGLPFSERWIAKQVKKPKPAIRKLLRFGVITTYPVLLEIEKGMVSQAEHTVIVTKKGCKVTTR